MIVRLEKRRQQALRRQLLTNVVWVICNDTLRRLQHEGQTLLAPIEVFMSAREFCDTILGLSDIDEGLTYEMDDLEDEATGENDAMLVMMLATALLQARSKLQVGIDFKKIIQRIYERWNDHELFSPLLEQFANKEEGLWLQGKKVGLYTYELSCIEEEEVQTEDGHTFVTAMVDSASGLTPNGIQVIENVLSEVNDKFDHRYQNELDRLREVRKKKSESINNIGTMFGISGNKIVKIGNK